MDPVRGFLSLEDRDIPFAELSPLEKRQAYIFYRQIWNGYVPDADEDNWISLGFCTAPDREGVSHLGDAYSSLVKRCQFEEFWRAMADATMIELFAKHGLGREIVGLRNFKDFMGVVAEWHQSVWELKRFTRMTDPDPIRAVVVDYGFMNCNTSRERALLREIYTDYFARGEDEMELHEACINGVLAKFLESVLGTLSVPHEVLANPYRLERRSHAGMVADRVVVCPESLVEDVTLIRRQDGRKGIILTIPDASDAAMREVIKDQAAFLDVGLRRLITLRGDKNMEEFEME